jgi:hypothetical protein
MQTGSGKVARVFLVSFFDMGGRIQSKDNFVPDVVRCPMGQDFLHSLDPEPSFELRQVSVRYSACKLTF